MTPTTIAIAFIAAPSAMLGYAYIGYPILLAAVTRKRAPNAEQETDGSQWPSLTITVPVYNEERNLAEVLEALLGQDYPAAKRHVLVVSDASTDRTDEIARSFASRGVELLRLPDRRGKTAAENAADVAARGEIIVNTDATVRLLPSSLSTLVRAFEDPSVGVASGRDVSVGAEDTQANRGESGYVGYEMWVRRLETRFHSIVGASGCFYATRRHLYDGAFPEGLSRDFASALIARRRGYRAVSVEDALCRVPRTSSLRSEFRRKVRTMARGLQTLWYMRSLMNPLRYGRFAFCLVSHKLCRWLVSLFLPLAVVGVLMLGPSQPLARLAIVGLIAASAAALVAMRWPERRRVPAALALPAFGVASFAAGFVAWMRALSGQASAVWEPTRRSAPATTNRPS
ncbi:MAG TPA: glycosyltransferase [Gemmatimonadaceae bacterium]|nr:glycosyltransferase [Gemmatimonadaceae bacterium]